MRYHSNMSLGIYVWAGIQRTSSLHNSGSSLYWGDIEDCNVYRPLFVDQATIPMCANRCDASRGWKFQIVQQFAAGSQITSQYFSTTPTKGVHTCLVQCSTCRLDEFVNIIFILVFRNTPFTISYYVTFF
jgi:hypothetical protein